MRCKAAKPAFGGGLVESEGLESDMKGDQPWREAMDPNTQMVMYIYAISNLSLYIYIYIM